MEKSNYDYLFRIVMAGDSGVGKTNLLLRYTENAFNFETKTTIGAQFSQKSTLVDGKNVECQIWDTAGQERFHSITCTYFRGAVGAVLVYDVCNRNTFNSLEKWLKYLRDSAEQNVRIILIGNKSDLDNLRQVSTEEGQTFAQNNSLEFKETSALTGSNVNLAFDILAAQIYYLLQEKARIESESMKKSAKVDKNKKVVLRGQAEKKNKKCCK